MKKSAIFSLKREEKNNNLKRGNFLTAKVRETKTEASDVCDKTLFFAARKKPTSLLNEVNSFAAR